MLPLPLLGGIGLTYFMLLFYPAVSCGDALSKARRSYVEWPGWRYIMGQDKCYVATVFASAGVGPLHPWGPLLCWPSKLSRLPDYETWARMKASHFLQSSILMPLESAVGADPGNALAWLELAEWYGEQCKVRLNLVAEPFCREALLCAERARLLDPDNKEAHLFQHRLYTFMAKHLSAHDKEQYGLAAAAMRAAVERDPTEARLRYDLAESLFLADLPVDGRFQARMAQELDEQSTQTERQLSDAQRAQIRTWLTEAK
jgi:hypothetical protein